MGKMAVKQVLNSAMSMTSDWESTPLAREAYRLVLGTYLAAIDSRAPTPDDLFDLELNGVQLPSESLTSVQRSAAIVKDFTRLIPKPIVVVVEVNGRPARALLDSGSLADFISTNLAEQLSLPKITLAKPITVQLAVQGSRSKINYGTKAQLTYQGINFEQYFDVANLHWNYDLILGTPFLFQHKVMFGLNDYRVIVGSREPVPIKGS